MAAFYAKKRKPMTREDRESIEKRLAATAAMRKTLRGYAVLKKKGSKSDVKINGLFKDRNELDSYVSSYAAALNKAAGSNAWTVEETCEASSDVQYESIDDDNEETNEDE